MKDIRSVISRGRRGEPLGTADLAALAEGLDGTPDDTTYSRIILLGKQQAKQYRQKIEAFLSCESDAWLAKAALQTLCMYWSESVQYRDELFEFVRGVEWDDEEDCRIFALLQGGALLHERPDYEMLSELIRVCTDRHEPDLNRGIALQGLAVALGYSIEYAPEPDKFDCNDAVTRSVMAEAEERLQTEALFHS